MTTLKDNLRAARMKKGLTTEKAAELLGMTKQALNHYETGRSVPKIDVLVRIARLLDVRASQLLGEDEDYPPAIIEAARRIAKMGPDAQAKLLAVFGTPADSEAVDNFSSPLKR